MSSTSASRRDDGDRAGTRNLAHLSGTARRYTDRMSAVRLCTVVAVLLGFVAPAQAQSLSLEFSGGRVRLTASNVPISRIVSEWARLGNTTILHGERVPGTPVTLQLVDVYEQDALRVLLRSTGGYLVAAREAPMPGASVFDRIMILPAGGSGARPAAGPATTSLFPDDFDFGDPTPPLPRGAVPPVQPTVPVPQEPQAAPPQPEQRPRNNPFRVGPGSSRPGVITPVEDDAGESR